MINKLRYIFLSILLFIVACLFWPKIIIVHYDNPDDPIMVSLTQYDDTKIRKKIESGTRVFRLRQGFSRRSSDLAFLNWYYIKDQKIFSLQGQTASTAEDSLDLNICRGNIYINKDGSIKKAEWTYPVFMNLCL